VLIKKEINTMEKFIILFECKSYDECDDTYTYFGTAVDRVYDTYEEAYNALVNEIIPDVQASMDEDYVEIAEADGVDIDTLREITVEMYKPTHPYDLVASVELYTRNRSYLAEEDNYKIIPIIC
jgi:hypothetical protein